MSVIRPAFPKFPASVLAQVPITRYPNNPKLGGAPVVFSAQAQLANNKSAVLNAQTLQSGFRTPYFIDEIRIGIVTEPLDVSVGIGGFTGLAGAVKIRFQTGSHAFSEDFVPVGLMAPYFGTDYGTQLVQEGTHARWYSSVRWMLPKPLFMPAGDVVLANVMLDNITAIANAFGLATAVTVTVTYVGRLVPQGYTSKGRDVPWLAWWSKTTSATNIYAEAQTRLRNPFLVPAHVQRFTSRTFVAASAIVQRYDEKTYDAQLANTGTQYETVAIQDSRGYAITNKFVPVGDVFDTSRHAWTFGRELSPREQFNMQLKTENTALIDATAAYTCAIGLVGYRTEEK